MNHTKAKLVVLIAMIVVGFAVACIALLRPWLLGPAYVAAGLISAAAGCWGIWTEHET